MKREISSSSLCPFAAHVVPSPKEPLLETNANPKEPLLETNANPKEPLLETNPNPKEPLLKREAKFAYDKFLDAQLSAKKRDRSYRYFNNINRLAKAFPEAHTHTGSRVVVWCSNDYLAMSSHPDVIHTMQRTLDLYGAGAGGTRNIAGNAQLHLSLERELADLHEKPAALVFSSCFVANGQNA
jgi:5-aminolevulinate synthase